MAGLSLSFVVGKASEAHQANIEHNNREFVAKWVDGTRVEQNVTYAKQDIREAYKHLFSEAVEEYNKKQKQPCRRKTDYYMEMVKNKREETFYELIVTFGDKDTARCGTPTAEVTKQMLDEYMRNFNKNNPNLYVFNAVMHLDESEPHLHIDVIPFYDDTSRRTIGLSKGVSMKAALNSQGFVGTNVKNNALVLWEERERNVLVTIYA